jgi:excisionase family DNA binding protein
MDKLLLTTEEAAEIIGICRTKVYHLIRTKQLESVRIGGSRRIPAVALEDFVHRLRDQDDNYPEQRSA